MENKPNRSLMVIYEDRPTRDLAMAFCDELIRNFWARCAFDVDWCSFESMADDQHARKAAAKAAETDLVLFAVWPDGEIPEAVRRWAQVWAGKRGDREGTIIGLLDPSKAGPCNANRYTWLRGIALQTGLNYLTQAPSELESIPDSPAQCTERAGTVTTTLDSILKHKGTPTLASGR